MGYALLIICGLVMLRIFGLAVKAAYEASLRTPSYMPRRCRSTRGRGKSASTLPRSGPRLIILKH